MLGGGEEGATSKEEELKLESDDLESLNFYNSKVSVAEVTDEDNHHIQTVNENNSVAPPPPPPPLTGPKSLETYLDIISRVKGMEKVYSVCKKDSDVRIKFVLQYQHGFRHHPITVQHLMQYHYYCGARKPLPKLFLLILVAMLVQGCLQLNFSELVEDVWLILCNEFVTPVDLTKDEVSKWIFNLAFKANYGPPIPGQELYLWELRDPNIVGQGLATFIKQGQLERKIFFEILTRDNVPTTIPSTRTKQKKSIPTVTLFPRPSNVHAHTDTSVNTRVNLNNPPTNTKSIKKVERAATATAATTTTTTATATPLRKPNTRLSSFFSIVKKPTFGVADSSLQEYFQPFFTKPNQRTAPINYFGENMDYQGDNNWDWSKRLVIAEFMRRKRCRCLGDDSKPALLVMKLLQFHNNSRPAYFGTLQLINPHVKARSPFSKAEDLNYEYDSDEDWGEDAEILDAESISGTDEEEDDYSSELSHDNENENDSSNNWVVPDGYISDDEGFGEHDDDLGEKRRNLSIDDPTFSKLIAIKKDVKRKYTEKQPIITGPFLQTHPSISGPFSSIKFSWMNLVGESKGCNPLKKGALPLFQSSENDDGTSCLEEGTAGDMKFRDEVLFDMASMVNGSTHGIVELYQMFSIRNGQISSRQFEVKLDQIAERIKHDGKTFWSLRPEYSHLLS